MSHAPGLLGLCPARALRCFPFPSVERAGGPGRTEHTADFLTGTETPRTVTDVLTRARQVAAVVAVAFAVALATEACGGATTEQVALNGAVTAANTTRLAVQSAETAGLALYRAEQAAAVGRVKAEGGTREQAEAAVHAIREKWQPVWTAIDATVAAHAALVAGIGAYENGKQVIAEVARMAVALAAAERDAAAAIERVKGTR